MNLANLTPHKIVIFGGGESIVINPSGQTARVAIEQIFNNEMSKLLKFPVAQQVTGNVIGLPEFKPKTFLIVSLAVRQAKSERKDLLSPGDLVRNKDGQPIGCMGLISN